MAADASLDRRWVFGAVPDLLLGCGLGYAAWIVAVPFIPSVGNSAATIGLFASLLIGAPHYGATLLRVYGRAADRRKYAFFGVYMSALVWLWFVAGLHDFWLGSAMVTLYLTWSPWHYTGQNYGLAVMFLRRRNVPFSDRTKRLLYASFALSFGLAFLSLHHGSQSAEYGFGGFMGTAYSFLPLGIPIGLWKVLFVAIGLAYIGVTIAAFVELLRIARPVDLVPVATLVVTQALWFTVPTTWAWATGTPIESEGVAFLFIWAVLGHSIQYLWITTYYSIGRDRGRARWGYLLATLGAGSAAWTLPAIVFSPNLLGTHPYSMGLFVMVASAVNLQHFVLDGAIWKLRDTGVGRILLAQPVADGVSGEAVAPQRSWPRAGAWAAGALLTLLAIYGAAERVAFDSAMGRGDLERARSAGARLAAIGRDHPRFHELDARLSAEAGELDAALEAYRSGIELHPTSTAWLGVGLVHERRGDVAAAERAYRASLAVAATDARALTRLGALLVRTGRAEEAVPFLSEAAALYPDDAVVAARLEAARAAAAEGLRP